MRYVILLLGKSNNAVFCVPTIVVHRLTLYIPKKIKNIRVRFKLLSFFTL